MANNQAKQEQLNIAEKYDLPLPLEYCKLDRAARLLGCEIQDIVHWGAIGAINICYWLDNVSVFMAFLNYAEKEKKEIIEGQLHIGYSFTPYAHVTSENPNRMNFITWGLWPLTSRCLQSIERFKPLTKNNAEFFARNQNDNIETLFSLPMSRPKENDDLDSLITIDGLWIVKPDLEKLHHAITTGRPLLNIYNNDELARKNREQELQAPRDKPHHRAESTAINREQVLAAAVNVREKHPDECLSFSKWAQAVVNHSRIYWPELDEPPLTLERIERIIASAVNNGKPDRKK